MSAATLLIVLAKLTADRESKGAEWCRKRGVGAIRHVIGSALPSNMVSLAPLPPEFIADQRAAATMLEGHCKTCRGCKLGRE